MSQTSDELSLPKQEAGFLFRAEMAVQSFILGYWMHMISLVVVGLVGILLYGQYQSWQEGTQKEIATEIVKIELAVREARGAAAYDPSLLSDEDKSALRGAAEALVGLATTRSGPEAAVAAMNAAETYRILGDKAAQRAAFEAAIPHASGPILFGAEAGRAALLVDAGENDAAIAAWTALSNGNDGFLGAHAMLELARAQATLGRAEEAKATYDAFLTRFPTSDLTAAVQEERAALGEGA